MKLNEPIAIQNQHSTAPYVPVFVTGLSGDTSANNISTSEAEKKHIWIDKAILVYLKPSLTCHFSQANAGPATYDLKISIYGIFPKTYTCTPRHEVGSTTVSQVKTETVDDNEEEPRVTTAGMTEKKKTYDSDPTYLTYPSNAENDHTDNFCNWL